MLVFNWFEMAFNTCLSNLFQTKEQDILNNWCQKAIIGITDNIQNEIINYYEKPKTYFECFRLSQ